MASPIVARRHGDDYQARLFWLKAACLLDPHSPVISVAYEVGPKGFDDIQVQFDPAAPLHDHEGKPIYREHIQCKWHTTAGSFGYADLIDPRFINATNFSLLQRARSAQTTYAPDGLGCQFKLLTNWRLVPNDPLQALVRKYSDSIDLKLLSEGKTGTSLMGKVRKLWREHLSLDDAGLSLVARVLAISETTESLVSLRDRLDEKFAFVGMKRVPAGDTGFFYDDLILKLLAQGRMKFDRATFRAMLDREGLLVSKTERNTRESIGVRSFMHPIDSLEERCSSILDFVPEFEGRYIRQDSHWKDKIVPQLAKFLSEKAKGLDQLSLIMDTHVSIAFAVGAVLNMKCGKNIQIEQRTNGRRFWSVDDTTIDSGWPRMAFQEEEIEGSGDAIALSIGLTHDISATVRSFIKAGELKVKKLLHCKLSGGSSHRSILNGSHAAVLAEETVNAAQSILHRSLTGRHTHIFIAGPNGFAFFLGQHQKTIGPCSIYEWDFDGEKGGGYSLGVTLGKS